MCIELTKPGACVWASFSAAGARRTAARHERVDEPARAAVVAGGALMAALRGDRERQQHVGVRARAEARVEAGAVVPVAVDPGLHAVGERPVALLVEGRGGGRRGRQDRAGEEDGERGRGMPRPSAAGAPRPSVTGRERLHPGWRCSHPRATHPRPAGPPPPVRPQRAREDRRHVVLVLVDERAAHDRVARVAHGGLVGAPRSAGATHAGAGARPGPGPTPAPPGVRCAASAHAQQGGSAPPTRGGGGSTPLVARRGRTPSTCSCPTTRDPARARRADRRRAPRRRVPALPRRRGRPQVIVPLDELGERITIGRRPSNDVALDWDSEVSRVHAALERTGEDWTVVDDGLSHNGTFVNGERVTGRRRLRDGDVISVGGTVDRVLRAVGGSTSMATVTAVGPHVGELLTPGAAARADRALPPVQGLDLRDARDQPADRRRARGQRRRGQEHLRALFERLRRRRPAAEPEARRPGASGALRTGVDHPPGPVTRAITLPPVRLVTQIASASAISYGFSGTAISPTAPQRPLRVDRVSVLESGCATHTTPPRTATPDGPRGDAELADRPVLGPTARAGPCRWGRPQRAAPTARSSRVAERADPTAAARLRRSIPISSAARWRASTARPRATPGGGSRRGRDRPARAPRAASISRIWSSGSSSALGDERPTPRRRSRPPRRRRPAADRRAAQRPVAASRCTSLRARRRSAHRRAADTARSTARRRSPARGASTVLPVAGSSATERGRCGSEPTKTCPPAPRTMLGRPPIGTSRRPRGPSRGRCGVPAVGVSRRRRIASASDAARPGQQRRDRHGGEHAARARRERRRSQVDARASPGGARVDLDRRGGAGRGAVSRPPCSRPPPAAAAAAARPRSPADWKRSSGAFGERARDHVVERRGSAGTARSASAAAPRGAPTAAPRRPRAGTARGR